MAIGPVEQIYAQAGAGSAQGQGFGDFAVQGMQLGLAGRRLQLEEERIQNEERRLQRTEQRDSMLLPLQQQALQLRNAATGLEIQKMQTDAHYELGIRAADLQVSQLATQLSQQGLWGSPQAWQEWDKIMKSAPLAGVSKSGQLFLQQQRLAMESDRLTQQFGKPTQVEVPTLGGGTTTFGGRPSATDTTSDIRNTQFISSLRQQISALPAGSPERAAKEQELSTFLQQTSPRGTVIRQTPNGGFEVIQGAPVSDLTTSVASEQQKNLLSTRAGVETVQNLLGVIANNPNAWGVRGGIGSAFEVLRGVFDPSAKAPTRDAINRANLAFTQIADSFKVDTGQMSNYERQKLEEAADIVNWEENQASANQKALNLLDALTAKHLRAAKATGKPPEDSVLRAMRGGEVLSLRQNGLLSDDDIRRAARLKREREGAK